MAIDYIIGLVSLGVIILASLLIFLTLAVFTLPLILWIT